MFLGKPKDSVWEDWGTLGKIREITPPLRNLIMKCWGRLLVRRDSFLLLMWNYFDEGMA